ncbi:hypothetical protein KCH_41850 [Kitasatospora cheerisanensis KCTC 2395]|uniref:Uncharacterized protein n=1 Tax=Kitasatospora cheerisanensis KCTC 2395 TaxID=1348663 RepID=A0A066YWP1_9ACTN|nr:hypothetical protein KCH_41850 [Kitasatospora cheerisanensis KCTC 2395]
MDLLSLLLWLGDAALFFGLSAAFVVGTRRSRSRRNAR